MAPSKEVSDAVGAAPERPDYAALVKRAEQVRAVVATPSDKEAAAAELQRVEAQLAAQKETEGTAAAQARITGVKRACGSCLNEYGKRRDAVYAEYATLSKAIEALNQMAAQIRDLHAEAEALAERFDLPTPALANPRSPDADVDAPVLPHFWRFMPALAATEFDEHQLRERRTYAEVGGSDAYRIIAAAGGPKPWPALTVEQQA